MRTADDVIKDWQVIQSGRTRWSLRDDEIMLKEVLRLRAENADMREELVYRWSDDIERQSDRLARKSEWLHPFSDHARHAAAQLLKLGLVEKHPDREAYRFITKGGE